MDYHFAKHQSTNFDDQKVKVDYFTTFADGIDSQNAAVRVLLLFGKVKGLFEHKVITEYLTAF